MNSTYCGHLDRTTTVTVIEDRVSLCIHVRCPVDVQRAERAPYLQSETDNGTTSSAKRVPRQLTGGARLPICL
jgi:hypothetical protein